MDRSRLQARHEGEPYRRVEVITGTSTAAELACDGEGSDRRREPGAGCEHIGGGAAQRRQPRAFDGVAPAGAGNARWFRRAGGVHADPSDERRRASRERGCRGRAPSDARRAVRLIEVTIADAIPRASGRRRRRARSVDRGAAPKPDDLLRRATTGVCFDAAGRFS